MSGDPIGDARALLAEVERLRADLDATRQSSNEWQSLYEEAEGQRDAARAALARVWDEGAKVGLITADWEYRETDGPEPDGTNPYGLVLSEDADDA